MKLLHHADELRALLAAAPKARACQCSLGACAGWESVGEERLPERIEQLATLRDPELYEPTFEERHPHGTRYDSAQAPVAIKHFPYNRCDLWRCGQCHRHLLRYTEFGGYYVDHRVRELSPTLEILD